MIKNFIICFFLLFFVSTMVDVKINTAFRELDNRIQQLEGNNR